MSAGEETLTAAVLHLQEAYGKHCTLYQAVLHGGGLHRNAYLDKWQNFQKDLVANAIKEVCKFYEIAYWNYFFDALHHTSVTHGDGYVGRIYFSQVTDRERREYFKLWETDVGRSLLKQRGVERLATMLRKSIVDEGSEYLVSVEMPWTFSFDDHARGILLNEVIGFHLDVPRSLQDYLRGSALALLSSPAKTSAENPFTIYMNRVREGLSSRPDILTGLHAAVMAGLRRVPVAARDGEIDIEELARHRTGPLLSYLAWLIVSLGDCMPSLAMYFPGAAGYSTMPDIGCAIGLGTRNLTTASYRALAALADLSLYYSMQPFARNMEIAHKRFLRASRDSARAAIMSRNLSHNVGSHVLSNPKLYEVLRFPQLHQQYWSLPDYIAEKDVASDPIGDAKNHLVAFHHYVQSRLDFIARSIQRQRERMDPLFLFGDVLKGYFRQRILLDTLLSDCGFSASDDKRHKPISFQVEINTEAIKRRYEFRMRHGGEIDLEDGAPGSARSLEDFLVGIPAGFVGCQAIYSFLENLMRNAAKYGGNRAAKDLRVHMLIRDARASDCADHDGIYVLEAWDNLGERRSVARAVPNVRRYLSGGLVDDQGRPVTQGLGIQEMRVAAEFISDHHDFIADDDVKRCACGVGYGAYVSRRRVAAVVSSQALRCYVAKQQCGNPQDPGKDERFAVTYQLLMPKARLLGIVPASGAPEVAIRAKTNPAVCWCPSIESLASQGAAFGVVLGCDEPNDKQLNSLLELHHALPYRIVVLTKDVTSAAKWTAEIGARECKTVDERGGGKCLPTLRVHVISDEELYGLMDKVSEVEPSCAFVGAKGWNAVVLKLYHLWLKAFKPPPDGVWRVLLGFDRDVGQVSSRWKKPLDTFKSNSLNGLQVDVRIAEGSDLTPSDGKEEFLGALQYGAQQPSFLVFDNHGRAGEKLGVVGLQNQTLDNGPAIYHEFGSKSALVLYQTLESPPQEPFSFAYWLYSLIEGALVKVLVMDERAIESLKNDGEYSMLHQLRVLPVAEVERDGNSQKVGPAGDNCFRGGHLDMRKMSVTWKYDAAQGLTSGECPGDPTPLSPFDAVIIHEGLVERLVAAGLWTQGENGKPGMERRLYSMSPRIIRTSGRGAAQRSLDKTLPFLEASELAAHLYQARNKPALGKAVLSVTGQVGRADVNDL